MNKRLGWSRTWESRGLVAQGDPDRLFDAPGIINIRSFSWNPANYSRVFENKPVASRVKELTKDVFISAAGRRLSMRGTVPIYLEWHDNWDADASSIYATAKNLQAGSTVIDVGANVGMMSCSLAAQRPDLKIIAIEPVPQNVECLRHNVWANGLNNVEVVHAAASDKAGTVHVNVNGPWSAVLPKDQGGVVEVPAITIDSYIDRCPAYIKIDVEGWEPYVIAGARATIAASRPLFFMEWNTWCLLAARHDPISFAHAIWDAFDILEQFCKEKAQGAPTWDRQIVHDNVALFGSITDLLMRPKPDAVIPSLDEMIYLPKMVDLLRSEIARRDLGQRKKGASARSGRSSRALSQPGDLG